MTDAEKTLLDRINTYAEDVLGDIDPQKTPVSMQLEKLKPIMETLARENKTSVEDIFIQYMDLASEASAEADRKFKEELGPDFDFKMDN
ncbi:MAG: hypothetical protein IJT16_00995 [Lachnospiraceae bacterium]|nr:hypothetical protein [Lachnospiraceae bacterium]